MPVLSDQDITRLVREEKLIEGFHEANLTPNGYDMRVGHHKAYQPNGTRVEQNRIMLAPGGHIVISTMEKFRLPEDVAARVYLRNTLARRGLTGSFGYVNAGFEGNLQFVLHNHGQDHVSFEPGMDVAQIVFEYLFSTPQKPYGERGGQYQGQSGPPS